MSKFNKTTAPVAKTSPIKADAAPAGRTFEGGLGYQRDAKGELFLLAVSNMVGEQTFYEGGKARDSRYAALIRKVAVEDPEWIGRFLPWLRSTANMRSASLVGALEAAAALVEAKVPGGRQLVSAVLQRADEPGEAIAYWLATYGRVIPKPIKRGIADAATRLYNERNLLKYDTPSKGVRFGDVLDLTHPRAGSPWQGDLFEVALSRRHGRPSEIPASLSMLRNEASIRLAAQERPEVLLSEHNLRAAGLTWEDALSMAGSRVPKKELWEAMIPSMGYMALLRNLRNFDEAGVSDRVAADVVARLADAEEVARSRQFPFRFLAAYRAVKSLRWGPALEQALTMSLANVPELPGPTLILVDVSGSMAEMMSAKSELNRADAAKVFGAALAMRGEADLFAYNTGAGRVQVPKGGSLLRLVESMPRPGGGTYTAQVLRHLWGTAAGYRRVVIITDEQTGGDVNSAVPQNVPIYTWNLGGYRLGHTPAGLGTRHVFGGLTDSAFQLIPLLETVGTANWPF